MAGQTIFYLEDSKSAQKRIISLFEKEFEVIIASTIREATGIISSHPEITCFIIDLKLADGEGTEFVKKIREIEKYDRVPVILMTSTLLGDTAYRAMKTGVNVSVSKMLSNNELRSLVASQVSSSNVILVSHDTYEFKCLEWKHYEYFYQFCPEVKKIVRGFTIGDARGKMNTALSKLINEEKAEIDHISEEKFFIHRIDIKSKE